MQAVTKARSVRLRMSHSDSWDMRELLFADTSEWRDAVNREYAHSTFDPTRE